MPQWVIMIIISVAINVAAYLITPKPKQERTERPPLEAPTADQRPMPVIFGDVLIKAPNCLWFGEKNIRVYKIEVD